MVYLVAPMAVRAMRRSHSAASAGIWRSDACQAQWRMRAALTCCFEF